MHLQLNNVRDKKFQTSLFASKKFQAYYTRRPYLRRARLKAELRYGTTYAELSRHGCHFMNAFFFPDSFGVDHKVGKQRVKVVCLDLTDPDNQNFVEQWALDEKCLWVHFGVPCGTASAARFRRLSKRQHGPPVLRTYRWPDGLPNLRGVNLQKVRLANRLYSFMSI